MQTFNTIGQRYTKCQFGLLSTADIGFDLNRIKSANLRRESRRFFGNKQRETTKK